MQAGETLPCATPSVVEGLEALREADGPPDGVQLADRAIAGDSFGEGFHGSANSSRAGRSASTGFLPDRGYGAPAGTMRTRRTRRPATSVTTSVKPSHSTRSPGSAGCSSRARM